MVEHKLVLFATVTALWSLVTLLIKLIHILLKRKYIRDQNYAKLCYFGFYVMRATLFCLKSFVPMTGLECSYGKIFLPVTEILVAKNKISVTGPAQPLIWTHQYVYKEKVARQDLGNRASLVDRAHMKRPSKMWRPIILKEMFAAFIFPFHCYGIAQAVKQNNFVLLHCSCFLASLALGHLHALRRGLANKAGSIEILPITSDTYKQKNK